MVFIFRYHTDRSYYSSERPTPSAYRPTRKAEREKHCAHWWRKKVVWGVVALLFFAVAVTLCNYLKVPLFLLLRNNKYQSCILHTVLMPIWLLEVSKLLAFWSLNLFYKRRETSKCNTMCVTLCMTELCLHHMHAKPRCFDFESKKKSQRHGVGDASSDWIIMLIVKRPAGWVVELPILVMGCLLASSAD